MDSFCKIFTCFALAVVSATTATFIVVNIFYYNHLYYSDKGYVLSYSTDVQGCTDASISFPPYQKCPIIVPVNITSITCGSISDINGTIPVYLDDFTCETVYIIPEYYKSAVSSMTSFVLYSIFLIVIFFLCYKTIYTSNINIVPIDRTNVTTNEDLPPPYDAV